MAKKRILIIDDEQDLIDVLKGRLEEAGYEADGETTPVKGQWSTTRNRPDLIVLDINMPGWLSGLDFIVSLAHIPTLTGLPILIYTSQQSPDVRDRALAAGAIDLFIKGAEDRALMDKIKLLLSEKES
ncbi:MAG: hypothetical protein A3G34_01470 [Candidatus Lindowbacteria bacterium RIFCSPLOWO2_12_FULL_62_27]|nr:MAG: hypothetical protein A3G34_01470 [Candidatus Lindowbacteria bacterium RIFCSPLOWO2_12_FULL_62_27]OGH61920.1 MAG: hypothetical protein A3I06_03485 [Candidatus Lindowbacteria bacterium RIFCSPLOWO2_02_FULL_62_12]